MGYLSDPYGEGNMANFVPNEYFIDPKTLIITDPAADGEITKLVKIDIAKVSTNVPATNAVVPCASSLNLPSPPPKYDPKNTKCNFSSLKITKPQRGFDLVVSSVTPSQNRNLAVIGGFKEKPAKVSAELQGPAGPCPSVLGRYGVNGAVPP